MAEAWENSNMAYRYSWDVWWTNLRTMLTWKGYACSRNGWENWNKGLKIG